MSGRFFLIHLLECRQRCIRRTYADDIANGKRSEGASWRIFTFYRIDDKKLEAAYAKTAAGRSSGQGA